ncbi:hypothetical protein GGX14DRAFT_561113 [Mycena pura]|uniref:Uncharacterized protein n=1 Tax=Mycena pura TaxID=153505 RepID=A0AAD6VP30_9AGAR|nr:hypothetical protein GGX14DRAFT_561113 [Mycena pura]
MSRTRLPAISPKKWAKLQRKALNWEAPTPPTDFPPALPFDPSDADVKAWLQYRQHHPVSGDWDDDEDEDDTEGGEAATLYSEVDDESEAERAEVEVELQPMPLSATTTPLRAVEASSFAAAGPRQSTSASPARQALSRIFSKLSIGKAKGSRTRDSTPPTLPTLPSLARHSRHPSTPAKGTSRSTSLAVSSQHSATPAKGRSHATARKFLLAFLHAHDAVHCCISGRVTEVECAHLVPRATTQGVHSKLEVAIGGRFHLHTRLIYIPLHTDHHKDLDRLNRTFIILTEPHVLQSLASYFDILNSYDSEPRASERRTRADFYARLRHQHPILSQGHRYQIRWLAITNTTDKRQAPNFVVRDEDTVFRAPFLQLPIGTTFANPLFILINALQHLEHNFASSLTWASWSWDHAGWVNWIKGEVTLKHLNDVGEGNGAVIDELAAFMVVAGRLRLRMGDDFRWGTTPSVTGLADIFNPDNDRRNSRPADEESHPSKSGTGAGRGRGKGKEKGKGKGKGKGKEKQPSGGQTRAGNTGGKTRALGSASACEAIAQQWRLQQLDGPQKENIFLSKRLGRNEEVGRSKFTSLLNRVVRVVSR